MMRATNKNLKRLLCISICIIAIFSAMFTGCGSSIVLGVLGDSVSFHTEAQAAYLSGDFNNISPYAAGVAELSRPNAVKFTWTDERVKDAYTITISETADFAQKLTYTSSTNSLEVYNLKIGTKYFWRVSDGNGMSDTASFVTSDVCPRNLYVDGVTNFRDVGGWMTESGKSVKQGLLIRGGRLNASYADEIARIEPDTIVPEITAAGIKTFKEELKIKSEIDFRLLTRNGYPDDMQGEPQSMVEGVDYYAMPMNGTDVVEEAMKQKLRETMYILTDSDNYPVFYHCNIGTDRTGMLTYLLNGLLGVSKDDLLRDYVFSNFGLIGEHRSVADIKDKYVKTIDTFAGDTLSKRIENFFISIGVGSDMLESFKSIML